MIASRVAQSPVQEMPQLQHSDKFVEKENPAIVRQTPVVKGDFKVSGCAAHSASYFTKSEVKGKNKNIREMPVFTGQEGSGSCIFTPDSGMTANYSQATPIADRTLW
jgi:hypothetical protein